MRLIIALVAAVLAMGGLAAAQPRAERSRAHLSVADRSPLQLRGAGFHRRERVRVVAHAGAAWTSTRHVRASHGGRFLITLSGTGSPPCGRLRALAIGAGGSRASLAGIKLPDCVIG